MTLILLLASSPSWRAAPPQAAASIGTLHAPDNNPVIDAGGCTFVPDTSHPQAFPCGTDNNGLQFAYLGAPLALDLKVSSPDGAPINVTIRWDTDLDFETWPFQLRVLNASAVQYFEVTPAAPNQPVPLHMEWTYWTHSANEIVSGSSSYYNVSVNASSATGSDPFSWSDCTTLLPYGNCFFKIAVATNSPPLLNGLQMAYTYWLSPPDPLIPAFAVSVSVQDSDNDPVVVTWSWDDGTFSRNSTAAAGVRTYFNATHGYSFPVNVTPKYQNYTLRVSVDDGVPTHNRTTEALISYYLDTDYMPVNLVFLSPAVGSQWQANETIPMEASMEEPEGEPITYYWDYGDGTFSANATLPTNGTVTTTHAYAVRGMYNVTLWATDGVDKAMCLNLNANCTETMPHWKHLTRPILVQYNGPPVVSLSVSYNPGVYGQATRFAVAALDPDADNLTVTWDFGDGEYAPANATAVNRTVGSSDTVRATQAHTYTHWGWAVYDYTFNVTVWVDDGQGHNVSEMKKIFVGSVNQGPTVVAALATDRTIHANESFAVNVTVRDLEGDTVWINVSFGDDRFWDGNVTPAPNTNRSLTVEHLYLRPGNYTINVTVTDRMVGVWMSNGTLVFLSHNATAPVSIEIYAAPPPPVSTEWNWIDYTTLAAVLAIPIALAARSGYRRYQERKED